MTSHPSIPHFAFPLRLDSGRFGVNEQDSLDDINDCVTVLLSTPLGSREELPDYGITDPTGERDLDTASILDAIAEWEDRAVADTEDPVLIDGVWHLGVLVGQAT